MGDAVPKEKKVYSRKSIAGRLYPPSRPKKPGSKKLVIRQSSKQIKERKVRLKETTLDKIAKKKEELKNKDRIDANGIHTINWRPAQSCGSIPLGESKVSLSRVAPPPPNTTNIITRVQRAL